MPDLTTMIHIKSEDTTNPILQKVYMDLNNKLQTSYQGRSIEWSHEDVVNFIIDEIIKYKQLLVQALSDNERYEEIKQILLELIQYVPNKLAEKGYILAVDQMKSRALDQNSTIATQNIRMIDVKEGDFDLEAYPITNTIVVYD